MAEHDSSATVLDFLAQCKKVVCVNSSVGLEAIMLEIEVDAEGMHPMDLSFAKRIPNSVGASWPTTYWAIWFPTRRYSQPITSASVWVNQRRKRSLPCTSGVMGWSRIQAVLRSMCVERFAIWRSCGSRVRGRMPGQKRPEVPKMDGCFAIEHEPMMGMQMICRFCLPAW